MKKATFSLYEYNELSKKAKLKARNSIDVKDLDDEKSIEDFFVDSEYAFLEDGTIFNE